MTYPLKFRQKVFATKEKFQLTFQETSERFDIPIRTLFRWQHQLEPCTRRNKPATKVNMVEISAACKGVPGCLPTRTCSSIGGYFSNGPLCVKALKREL